MNVEATNSTTSLTARPFTECVTHTPGWWPGGQILDDPVAIANDCEKAAWNMMAEGEEFGDQVYSSCLPLRKIGLAHSDMPAHLRRSRTVSSPRASIEVAPSDLSLCERREAALLHMRSLSS